MSQHGTTRPRRGNNPVRPQHQNERQAPGQREPNQEPNAHGGEIQLPAGNASAEQWKQVALQFQLLSNERGQQLAQQARHPDHPENDRAADGPAEPIQPAQQSTNQPTIDDKYKDAGKRCALMRMLWVFQPLVTLVPNPEYSPEVRYDKTKPFMAPQGELQDVLSSMPEGHREGFLKYSVYQKLLRHGVQEERHNLAKRARGKGASQIFGCEQDKITCDWQKRMTNEGFQALLGYNSEGKNGRECYPRAAPVLYKNGAQVGRNTHIFRSEYILKERKGRTGPFTRLLQEWNRRFFPHSRANDKQGVPDEDAESDPSDIEDALAQIEEFAKDSDGEEEEVEEPEEEEVEGGN
ncbi:hypothetical protein FRC07_004450 [Ceratobasidium sp. 392]|nr:hypothetical protein FRC07_004450 [Ceratobasidium sp. 392]